MKTANSDRYLTRRDFLVATSAAAGTVSGIAAIPAVHADGDDELKVALIGCGGRGTGAAAQALSTAGKVRLVAMADAFRDQLDASLDALREHFREKTDKSAQLDVPGEHKFVGFDAYKQAIALADVVVLATPPGFRPLHFEEAVRQGKHVFMEKPVAVDAPGVRRVIASASEAKKKNLKVGSGFVLRYVDGHRELVKRIHDGAIGDVMLMRALYDTDGVWVRPRRPGQTEMEYQMRNWYYFVWLCGDQIVEQHCHNIDYINWVKQTHPVRAQGMGGRQTRTGKDNGEIFDHNFVEYEYPDGSRLFSQCRHQEGCWSMVGQTIHGTLGTAESDLFSKFQIRAKENWRHRGEGPEPYQAEHDALFAAIRNNTPHNEAESAAISTMTSIMGRMAVYSGKLIEWDQAINSQLDLSPAAYDWNANPPTMPDENGSYPIPKPGVTVAL